MAEKHLFLISDLHLGAVPRETEVAFRAWLKRAEVEASRVIINGDLFDFWFEYGRVVPSEHVRVLAALADLVESGVPVDLVGGNHDWWGGEFFPEHLGVNFHPDPIRIEVGGRTMLIAHGDGLGAGDVGYRLLKRVLRGRITRWAFRWLHPDIGAWLADRISDTKERAHSTNEEQFARARFLESWARKTFAEEPELSYIALGHTHTPDVVTIAPGKFYMNSGDWVFHRSYITIGSDGVPVLHDLRA